MLEIKVTIEAPALATAINVLAKALSERGSAATQQVMPTTVQQATNPTLAPTVGLAPATTVNPAPVNSAPTLTQPVQQTTVAPTSTVPLANTAPQYTVDQIMTAGATLMDAGKVNDLVNLLRQFGAQAVTDLKPEMYGAFATALRNLGAKI